MTGSGSTPWGDASRTHLAGREHALLGVVVAVGIVNDVETRQAGSSAQFPCYVVRQPCWQGYDS